MQDESEKVLVKRVRTGDEDAFRELLRRHQPLAFRLAFRLTGSRLETEDVLQEAWMNAYRGIGGFDGRARFSTWLCSIVLHTAASHARDRRRVGNVQPIGPGRADGASAAEPHQAAETRELDAAIARALTGLPPVLRSALVLVSFEGMSYDEAARVQQCPEGTLAWRVAEARRRLADELAPYLD